MYMIVGSQRGSGCDASSALYERPLRCAATRTIDERSSAKVLSWRGRSAAGASFWASPLGCSRSDFVRRRPEGFDLHCPHYYLPNLGRRAGDDEAANGFLELSKIARP